MSRHLSDELQAATKVELSDCFYREALSFKQVLRKYRCGRGTLLRALKVHGIELNPMVWRSGASLKQRKLAVAGVKLTDRQRQILVGSLLGDGWVTRKQPKFGFSQCAKYREYVTWMARELEPFSSRIAEYSLVFKSSYSKASDKVNKGYNFYTICHPDFIEYRKLFYSSEKKIVPINIKDLLTEVSLAVWYCEDGSNHSNWRSSMLNTQGFTEADCYLLIDTLYHKFNVKSRLRYEIRYGAAAFKMPQPVIVIGAKEGYDNWHMIVDPFVKQFGCFKHKLGRSRKESRKGELVNTSKLTGEDIRNIREAYKLPQFTIKEWAEKYNVGSDCISAVIHRRTWKHI